VKHERFDIWEEEPNPGPISKQFSWRAQLLNSVGYFPTREAAEKFVAGVKLFREKAGLDVPRSTAQSRK